MKLRIFLVHCDQEFNSILRSALIKVNASWVEEA